MLKKLILNKRIIPIPVPIRTLEEALTWLSQTLIKADEEMTKIVLDGRDLISEGVSIKTFSALYLDETSRLEVQADSPLDLSLQSLDAVRNLALVIERGLKTLAVKSWQTLPTQRLKETEALHQDLSLMRDLCLNATDLISGHIDTSVLIYLVERLMKVRDQLISTSQTPDWQQYARILLNKLEVSLPEVANQAETIQSQIYCRISDANMRKTETTRPKEVSG